MSEFLTLEDLTLAYGGTVAVDRLNLDIRQGELIALLGPSGCGKTTTMRAVAGLLSPKSGTIRLDGRDITRVAPSRREVGLVFQSYALFPHLTVFENVAFGLRLKREAGRTAPADLLWTGAAPVPAGQRSLNLFEEPPASSQAAE